MPALAVAIAVASTGCTGSDTDATETSSEVDIVVTNTILGDIVGRAVGSQANVEVLMPIGADPHDFAPSARQADALADADLVVVNGAGFEAGMSELIEQVTSSGTDVFAFADHVDLLILGNERAAGHDGDGHVEDGHDDGDDAGGHDDPIDPHLWMDPTRVADALDALEPVVAALDGVDSASLAASFDSYREELGQLDATVANELAQVEHRTLVTNHDVLGYFADRYGFDIAGAVIPSLTTGAKPSARQIEQLAEVVHDQGVSAIFAETTQPTRLAEALADLVGDDVAVVELHTESLGSSGGEAATYVDMMQTNVARIAEALR